MAGPATDDDEVVEEAADAAPENSGTGGKNIAFLSIGDVDNGGAEPVEDGGGVGDVDRLLGIMVWCRLRPVDELKPGR